MADTESIGEALEAAFDEAEAAEEATEDTVVEATEETPEVVDTGAEGEVDSPPDPGLEPEGEVAAEPEATKEVSAPEYLSPEAREAWKDTPDPIKAEYATREANYQRGIEKFKGDAGRAQQMDQALSPYGQFFAMNGNNPPATINNLLGVAATLQGGATQQKAEMIANLINQFDVDVSALDGLLSGQGVPHETQQASLVQQEIQQALAPVQQFMQSQHQQQQHQQTQQTNQINSELHAFAAQNEFYADVRSDMADLMDMAGNRGVEMNLQDAYNKAVMLRPDIQKVLQARTSQQQVNERTTAASSIAGSPGGTTQQANPTDIGSLLEAAWPVEQKI